jgi:hypothetical protein
MYGSNGQSTNGLVKSGNWTCSCGQIYRVLAADGDVRMWPKNSADGFRVDPIGLNCVCGAPLARATVLSEVFGATLLS